MKSQRWVCANDDKNQQSRLNKSGVRRQRVSELCGYTVLPTVWVRGIAGSTRAPRQAGHSYQEYAVCVALAWFATLKRERSRVHNY